LSAVNVFHPAEKQEAYNALHQTAVKPSDENSKARALARTP
jgi:hypothetical protein